MDWKQALQESGIWLAQAYAITLVASALAVWFLARRTVWGRQFWALSSDYFSPRRSWRPLLGIALILLLTLAAVRLQILFSNWYNALYSSLQALDSQAFWLAMWLFAVLATVHVLRSLFDVYIQQAFILHWREWLNEKLLQGWLHKQVYYRSQYLEHPVDNPDQRIQQDITSFAETSMSLFMGTVNALVSTVAFTLILWSLSGPLDILGITVPRAMVFVVFLYVLVATVLAVLIGRPLISLNFQNERYTADYRYALVRVREYGESIAFYAGEKIEHLLLNTRFALVIRNAWQIVFRTLKLMGFNFAVSQTAVVFPMLLQASRFFSQQITLGDLMQTMQAFDRLQDNLSFFRNAYDAFASYRATLTRLNGFILAAQDAENLPRPQILQENRLALQDLTVRHPDGQTLAGQLNLSLAPAQSLLIRGPSGSGKTTLLRAIAGLWPYSEGTIIRPEHVLFLSQKPYLPLGSLRSALHYPSLPALGDSSNSNDDAAAAVLRDVHLAHLIPRLDEAADWSRILSLGEQQRLAFGRLLLAQPQAAFLDEASSALDEGLQDAMYRLVRQRLPQAWLISVGHRNTLLSHHGQQLLLDGRGGWQLEDISLNLKD